MDTPKRKYEKPAIVKSETLTGVPAMLAEQNSRLHGEIHQARSELSEKKHTLKEYEKALNAIIKIIEKLKEPIC